jgi:hypothetical protein
MKSIRLLAATALTLSLAALTSFAADPNGIWKFKAEGPKGRSVEATLVLKWENNQLSGSVENRLGKAEINEATFANDQITFTVAREFRGKKLTSHYSGKLSDNSINGTIETTGREEKPISIPWEAQRGKK